LVSKILLILAGIWILLSGCWKMCSIFFLLFIWFYVGTTGNLKIFCFHLASYLWDICLQRKFEKRIKINAFKFFFSKKLKWVHLILCFLRIYWRSEAEGEARVYFWVGNGISNFGENSGKFREFGVNSLQNPEIQWPRIQIKIPLGKKIPNFSNYVFGIKPRIKNEIF